ncbi:MAG: iron-containing alcohol dehydrogenase [Spirochaetaceae bacterium]|jgi:alcohol dehydrogenase YqhD (iron-dependent ADH family)|nr:iron-containing alcohol dehydrogenase [Spirochaetaceae bacterium]
MNNFYYYTPTKVVFGKNSELETGRLVAGFGGKRVLLHFGGASAKKSGLLDKVCASLKEAGLSFVELGGVVPNPRLSKVREGIALCEKEGVDFILAIGGGSVIDSAKAIGFGLFNKGDVWDFYSKKREPKGSIPAACVLTIAATGSEMSDSSVITNEEGALKRGCNSDYSRLKFAIMNPELTFTLPWFQKASGAADIIMHTLERWFDNERKSSELTDAISVSVIKTVMQNIIKIKKEPSNYDAAAELMWAGSLSHNGLTNCGGSPGRGGDWACHQLEHELGGMFDVAHGAGLCAVWGSWARFVSKENPWRFAALARELFSVNANEAEAAKLCIEKFEAFFVSIDMPVNISGLGVSLSKEQIKELAWKCSFFGTRKPGAYRPLDIADMETIFSMAK